MVERKHSGAYAEYKGKRRNYDACPDCGGTKMKVSAQCRSCRTKAETYWKPCPGCGTRIIARRYQQCRECFDASRIAKKHMCVGCGQETKQYAVSHFAARCRACDMIRRRSAPAKPCSVAGCQDTHKAKGFCQKHYNMTYAARPHGYGHGGRPKLILATWPCQICGYRRMNSDVHRLIPGAQGGRYTIGNIVALCVRCHREVHRGLEVAPNPPTEEEFRQTHV